MHLNSRQVKRELADMGFTGVTNNDLSRLKKVGVVAPSIDNDRFVYSAGDMKNLKVWYLIRSVVGGNTQKCLKLYNNPSKDELYGLFDSLVKRPSTILDLHGLFSKQVGIANCGEDSLNEN